MIPCKLSKVSAILTRMVEFRLVIVCSVALLASQAAVGCSQEPPMVESGGAIRIGSQADYRSIQAEVRPAIESAPSIDMAIYAKAPCVLHLGAGVDSAGDETLFRVSRDRAFRTDEVMLELVAKPEMGWVSRPVVLPEDGVGRVRFEIDGDSEKASWARPRLDCPRSSDQLNYKNVILVSLDTLRADRIGAYGGRNVLTPHIDRIANQGVLFERAYAAYPNTMSSHASLFTGLLPSEHGVLPGRARGVSDERETLAEVFADAGYSTAAFTENGFVSSRWGFAQGFDLYDDGSNLIQGSSFAGRAENTFGRAIDWLAQKSDAPVFLFIHSYQVHIPYSPPPREISRLSARRLHRYQGRYSLRFDVSSIGAFNAGDLELTPLERRQVELLYDAEVRSLDAQVGRLDRAIHQMGIEDETLLVLFSDHGEEFFEHGYLGHGSSLHQQALHVPVILRNRGGLPSGKRIPEVAGLIDLGPTLVELAGIASRFETNSSVSLAGVALNEQPGRKVRPVVSERFLGKDACAQQQKGKPLTTCAPMEVAIRDGEHTFIYDPSSDVARLYNVSRDPREQRDLAGISKKQVDDYKRQVAKLPKLDGRVGRSPDRLKEIPSELERNLRALGYIE